MPTPINSIKRLPEILINQIAAGEVVERPSSVVKELVENCIDANARRIEIHLKDGGMTEIEIIDNGHGMPPEDLALSIERHATSKLGTLADLEAIGTFGFRGEALSSIASVSELTITSRMADSESAHRVDVLFGEVQGTPRPCPSQYGTRILVKNLFSKIPARLKFLKSAQTEFSHISRMVKELALGNHEVQFFLHHQGRLVSSYVTPTREERVKECLKMAWTPVHVVEPRDEMELEAFLSPASLIQDRGDLVLFVNGRSVKNRNFLAAVRAAYHEALGPHHDPTGAVFLDLRLDWVDVNVHPQKLEVRCLKQEQIYPWILSAVRKRLVQQQDIREPAFTLPTRSQPYEFPAAPMTFSAPYISAAFPTVATPAPVQESLADWSAPSHSPSPTLSASFRYLGQAKAAYLICEDEKGLVLVDQHALHEKMAFEKLMAGAKDQKPKSQVLLIPKILRLPADLVAIFEETKALLASQGFELEGFGDGDIAIKAIPESLSEEKASAIVESTLRLFQEDPSVLKLPYEESLRPVLATMACHSVVRAGQNLSDTEALSLLRGMDSLQEGWTCPHGRPVLFRMTYSTIAKHFERQ